MTDTKVKGFTRWVLIATILASSMAFIDSSALQVALPALQTDLGANASQLIWVQNAYTLILSALILLGGSLGDIYGRKRVFSIGIGFFTLASGICGFAPTIEILIAARVLQGIGGALMVPGSLALITALIPGEERGRAIGTWSTFSTMTTLLGPAFGGVLADLGLWRGVFWINLPIAVFALYILVTRVPESHSERGSKQLDIIGAVLATLGLAGLAGGTLALVAFVVVEARSSHPMMPLRLFKSRTFTGTNALTLFLYAALGVLPFFLTLNLQQIQGYDATIAGFALLPFSILLTVMSRWAGGLVDRVGARLPLTIGPALTGVGFALFALPGVTGGQTDYWVTYFPGAFMLGVGMGITVAPLVTAIMGSAPADSAGTASGINNAVARTAGVLAIAILGAVVSHTFATGLQTRAAELPLTAEQEAQVNAEAPKLADAKAPAGLAPEVASQVTLAMKWSFVETFRMIAIVSAVLAWISAVLGWLLVEGKPAPEAT